MTCRSPRLAAFLLCCAGAVAMGCASAPKPLTRIVNGRVIVTRSVSPEAYAHVTRAMLYEEEERWQDAADELQRALPFDPEAAEIRAHLAELFIKLGRLDDAAEQIDRSLKIAPTVDGYLAKAHLAEAHPTAAGRGAVIPALRQAAALAMEGEDPRAIERAHLELADAQVVVALDLPGALATLRKLVQITPHTARGRISLAVVAWPLGAHDEAIASVKAALGEEPNDIEARILLAQLQVATGQTATAKASFRIAIDRADAPLEIAEAVAGWLVLRGELAEARELADRLTPDAANVETLTLASALERTVKRPDRARALAEKAGKLGAPAGQVALLLGAVAAAADDDAGALGAYLGVPKKEAAFFESRLRAADLLREQGKLDEAQRALDQVGSQTDAGKAADLAIARARLDEKRGDAALAARRLDEALAKDRENVRLILALASVDERRGEWRRALERAEALLARKPRTVEALNFAGFVAADHGHELPLAVKRILAAVALSPGSGGIVDSLGWAYFKSGDLGRAALFLEQAGRLEPGDPEILTHLGDLYLRRQERERALAAYRKAQSMKPDERVARELGDRIRNLEAKSAAGR